MADMNFQAFLQSQGMSNMYPPQTYQPVPQHRRIIAQTNPFVLYAPHGQPSIMAYTGAQPSFFADEMYYHRDEQAVFEEMVHQPLATQPAVPNFTFRPLLPTVAGPLPVLTAPSPLVRKTESLAPLVIPGVLGDHVDHAQYSHVSDEDWKRASIDYDASSPDSVDTHATSPLTPATDGSGSFTEHFFRNNDLATNSIASAFAAKQHDSNLLALPMFPAAMPSTFGAPPNMTHGHDTSFAASPAPQAYDSFGIPTTMAMHNTIHDSCFGQGHHHHMGQASGTTPAYESTGFGYDDLRELDQTSEGDEEGSALSEAEDQRSTSSRGSSSSSVDELTRQRDRDEFLIEQRRRGVPYREIKRRGGFREAESTLRGRIRVLTKDKTQRVRKPAWTERDEDVLRRAVEHFTGDQQHGAAARAASRKIPWGKVTTWMKTNGSTYLFAPATCAKQWHAMNEE